MRMPAYKQLRRVCINFRLYLCTIPIRITANMRYPNIHVFTFKSQVFRIGYSYVSAIYIAVNAPEWLKGSKLVCYFNITEIAGMPDLVAVFKVFKNRIVKVAVRIRYKAYS